MVGLLVTGHGQFAAGLGSAMKLIVGSSENVVFVNFEEEHSTAVLTENLNHALDQLKNCDGVLVLADLEGGSPFRCAVECKVARPMQAIEVLSGTNLPMLVEGAMTAESYDSPLGLAETLMETGKDNIVRFKLAALQAEPEEEEDGI